MYELFLTGIVDDAELDKAKDVFGALCRMTPYRSVNRVLYYQGPPRPGGMANLSALGKPIRKEIGMLWKELHQTLTRQSYILQARYEVVNNRDGPIAPPLDLDATPGILRFTDFPDPPRGQPLITQRKKVEIWEQQKLPTIMAANNYQLKTEKIEEVYQFFRDEVEFCLVRDSFAKPLEDYVPMERKTEILPPSRGLPDWETITPLDMEKRWLLFVKINVQQDNKPDEIRKAQEQLLAITSELERVIEFKSIDRRCHDTRVAQQQQGIQALPQKVMLGKS